MFGKISSRAFTRSVAVLVLLSLIPIVPAFSGEGTVDGSVERNKTPFPKTVAVFDFFQEGPKGSTDPADLPELIGILFLDAFQGRETVTIVEREKLVEVMAELHLGTSSIADMNTRLRLGRFLRADYFVFGSYLMVGGQVLISAYLVSIESGFIIKAADADGPRSQTRAVVERLAAKLLEALDSAQGK